MIRKIEIAGVHTTVDDDLRKYAIKKIGRLDRYLPRRLRTSLHVELKFKEEKSKSKNQYTCEVNLHVPQEVINIQESTVNMYAAIDIVEAKFRLQLKKYKELHTNPKMHQRMLARLKHQAT